MMMRHAYSMIVVAIFAIHNISIGQSVKKMIDVVKNSPYYTIYSKHTSDINGLKIKAPIIEEINLRTETDQNNLARQEFALRTIFNPWGLSKIYQKQKELLVQRLEVDREEQIQKDLYVVYNDVIKIYFLAKEDSLLAAETKFNQRKLDHLIRIIGSGADINAKEVLRLEEEIYKSFTNRALIGESLKSLYSKYGINEVANNLFSLEQISSKVNLVTIDQNNSFGYKKSILENEENDLNFALEKKDARRVLDYAQLRYSRRDNLLFQDEFSLGLGLRLPYKGSLSADKMSLNNEKWDIEYNSDIGLIDKITDLAEMKRKFNTIIEKIKYFQKSQDKVFAALNSQHPEVAEEISYFKEDLKLSTELKIISLEEEIWFLYLDILLKAEQINSNPIEIIGTN